MSIAIARLCGMMGEYINVEIDTGISNKKIRKLIPLKMLAIQAGFTATAPPVKLFSGFF